MSREMFSESSYSFCAFFSKKVWRINRSTERNCKLTNFYMHNFSLANQEIKDDRDSPNSTSFPAMMVAKILDEQLVIPMTRRMQILQLEST